MEQPAIARTDSLESATSATSSSSSSGESSLFSAGQGGSRRTSTASSLFPATDGSSLKMSLSDQSTPTAETVGLPARPDILTRSSYQSALAQSMVASMASLNVNTPHARTGTPSTLDHASNGFPWASGGVVQKHQAAFGLRKSKCFVATTSSIFGESVEDPDSEDEDETAYSLPSGSGSRHRSFASDVKEAVSSATVRQQASKTQRAPLEGATAGSALSSTNVGGLGISSASIERRKEPSPAPNLARNYSENNMFYYSPPALGAGCSSSRLACPSTADSACTRYCSIDPSASAPPSARPVSSGSLASTSTRPWVRDSDASSVRSSGTMSYEGSIVEAEDGMSVKSPLASMACPFLSKAPPPKNCKIVVDLTQPLHFLVTATLPGFNVNNITLALKRNGALHIIADRYEDSSCLSCSPKSKYSNRSSGSSASSQESDKSCKSDHGDAHFERLVELGPEAQGGEVSAVFDDKNLNIKVKKRQKKRADGPPSYLNYLQ